LPFSAPVTSPSSSNSHPDIPYAAIVEQSLAGVYVLQDECFQYANATFAALVGYMPEEMIGAHVSKFVPPAFLDEVLDRYYRRIAGDPPSMRCVTHGLHRDARIECAVARAREPHDAPDRRPAAEAFA